MQVQCVKKFIIGHLSVHGNVMFFMYNSIFGRIINPLLTIYELCFSKMFCKDRNKLKGICKLFILFMRRKQC